mgnify:CR=1 FL=1
MTLEPTTLYINYKVQTIGRSYFIYSTDHWTKLLYIYFYTLGLLSHKNSSEQYDYHASRVTHVRQIGIMHHLHYMHGIHVHPYIKRGKGCLKGGDRFKWANGIYFQWLKILPLVISSRGRVALVTWVRFRADIHPNHTNFGGVTVVSKQTVYDYACDWWRLCSEVVLLK